MEAEAYFPIDEKQGVGTAQKGFHAQKPHRVLLGFRSKRILRTQL